MATYKKWTAQEKLSAVLDGLKGRSVQEVCAEYGISSSQYYKWRDEALNAVKTAFESRNPKKAHKSHENERNQLLKIIGEQQLIIDIQKKISNSL